MITAPANALSICAATKGRTFVKSPVRTANPIVTAGLRCAPALPQATAVMTPHITANAQPAVITIHPEFSALDFFRTTAATTPSPSKIKMSVPRNSPKNGEFISVCLLPAPLADECITELRPSRGRKLRGEILNAGDLRDVPAATNSLDQEHAGSHAARADVDGGDFIGERGTLSDGDFEIAGDTTSVAIFGKGEGVLRRRDSCIFGLRFFLQNTESSEIVFHLLKSGEDRLPVIRDKLFVGSDCLFGGSPAAACVEKSLHGGASE